MLARQSELSSKLSSNVFVNSYQNLRDTGQFDRNSSGNENISQGYDQDVFNLGAKSSLQNPVSLED